MKFASFGTARSALLVCTLISLSGAGMAQTNAPAALPGKGLAQHDFFYAGESKVERMSIVRGGQVVWSYTHSGKGEISDAVLEPNGNILFAHQFGITEINLDKKVVWNFDAPERTEIHTAQPIGANSVWYIQNGNPAKFTVMDKASGKIEHQFELPVKNPGSVHGQFRQARLTVAGTILVAHMDAHKVVEYDLDGKVLWSRDVANCWSAAPLGNGNILVSGAGDKFAREINRKGETVWEWTAADAPEYKFSNVQTATRLPNGNTIINNWFNEWGDKLDSSNAPIQAIEVTPDKKVVWALRAWTPPSDLGPSTTIQILDEVYGPAVLPGKGLAQHPFVYTGEWDYRKKEQTIYVVRGGKVAWQYAIPTDDAQGVMQELGDATMRPNGNIVFCRKTGASEITPGKKIVWDIAAPKGAEIHSVQPIGLDRVLVTQNGNPAKLMLINTVTGKTEKEVTLPVPKPDQPHLQFRRVRQTKAGTYLAAHLDNTKVVEYDANGKAIWTYSTKGGPWSAQRLTNGNTLITTYPSTVYEVNQQGEVVWEFSQKDAPLYRFFILQEATRLANGNTVIFSSTGGTKLEDRPNIIQVIEVTRDKKLVWVLQDWKNLGPATTAQFLDEPGVPERPGDLQK